KDSSQAKYIAELWLNAALYDRDFDATLRALAALPSDGCHRETILFPKVWCEGIVAQMRGDTASARAAFSSTRNEMAKLVREQPAYAEALCALGMADAALGHKEDAIREGRRAVELYVTVVALISSAATFILFMSSESEARRSAVVLGQLGF